MRVNVILVPNRMLLGYKASGLFYPGHFRMSCDRSMSKILFATSNKGFPDTGMFSEVCGILLSFLNFIDKLTNGLEL